MRISDWSSDVCSSDLLSRYRPRTKRRIEGLLNERKALQEEAEQLRPRAQQFENMVKYVEEAGLETAEVNQTFEAARLIKAAGRGQVDPAVALEAIMPFVQSLQADRKSTRLNSSH